MQPLNIKFLKGVFSYENIKTMMKEKL